MATFAVTNAADAGAGSLRAAIIAANATPTTADVITFNIAGADRTIDVTSVLPAITAPVTIDATTQPGYAGKPIVMLNGAAMPAAFSGVYVSAKNVTVKGLVVGNFKRSSDGSLAGHGVYIAANAENAKIENLYAGVALDGVTAAQNGGVGIRSLARNTSLRHVLSSANGGSGVQFSSSSNGLYDSKIGTDITGQKPLGNAGNGVSITAGNTHVLKNNVISANGRYGVEANGFAKGVLLESNKFGQSADRKVLMRNGIAGAHLVGTDNSLVTRNYFAGNGIQLESVDQSSIWENSVGYGPNTKNYGPIGYGIALYRSHDNQIFTNQVGFSGSDGIVLVQSNRNTVRNNGVGTFIGMPSARMPNRFGIRVIEGYDNKLGVDGQGNTVAYNTDAGIQIDSGTRNSMFGNIFTGNGTNNGVHIRLGNVNPNDGNWDLDQGPNDLQSAPMSTFGWNINRNTRDVEFSLKSAYDGPFRIDVYRWSGATLVPFYNTIVQRSGYDSGDVKLSVPGLVDGDNYTLTATRIVNGVPTSTSQIAPWTSTIERNPFITKAKYYGEISNAVEFTFSSDVGASVSSDDVVFRNLDTGVVYAQPTAAWNAATKTARYSIGLVPQGRWVAELNLSRVKNVNYTATGGNNKVSFTLLYGDANRDGKVNAIDMAIVTANKGKTGMKFSQGDFNYDGVVDEKDLALLTPNYAP